MISISRTNTYSLLNNLLDIFFKLKEASLNNPTEIKNLEEFKNFEDIAAKFEKNAVEFFSNIVDEKNKVEFVKLEEKIQKAVKEDIKNDIKNDIKSDLEKSFEILTIKMDAKIDKLDSKIDKLDSKIDFVAKNLDDKINNVNTALQIEMKGYVKNIKIMITSATAIIIIVIMVFQPAVLRFIQNLFEVVK